MLTQEKQERLRRYFYGEGGDTFMLMNVNKMRKKFPDIPLKDMKEWYDSQELVQIMRPPPMIVENERIGEAYKPIVAWYPFQRLYLDTMFINRLKLIIVVGMDLY